jgi:hypothetical protein
MLLPVLQGRGLSFVAGTEVGRGFFAGEETPMLRSRKPKPFFIVLRMVMGNAPSES